jgi:dTDP-4-dehydrorhamnose reductase
VGTDEYPTKATRPENSVLGHQRTLAAGVDEMRNWKDALAESIGGIIAVVEKENVQ